MKRTYCGKHRGAAAEDAADAGFVDIDFLGERLEQFGRGEEAADFAVFEDHRGLIDDVLHVGLGFVELLVRDQLLHPARIEIDEIAGAAAHIGQMLDGEAQPARAGRSHHEPGAARGKCSSLIFSENSV
jgi:hypothetical protein